MTWTNLTVGSVKEIRHKIILHNSIYKNKDAKLICDNQIKRMIWTWDKRPD